MMLTELGMMGYKLVVTQVSRSFNASCMYKHYII